jgi:hypothetical protein
MAFSTAKGTITSLTFPHLDLTIISGKSTYATIRKLQKELYANAKAIPSTPGGGHNGHLALIMTAAEYLVNQLYDGKVTQVALHVSVINALCQQILCAVNNMYPWHWRIPTSATSSPRATCSSIS